MAGRGARVALLGIRCDRGSSFMRGSADAPPVLRAALRCDSGNDFAEGAKALGMGLWGDGGDLIEPTDAEAGAAVGRLLSDGYSPIVLGGDHAITRMVIPAVRSHMSHLDQPVATELASATDDGAVSDTVNAAVTAARRPLVCLQFDAHPDLYTELPCVSGADPRDSHAAQFTRLLEGPDPQIDLLIQVTDASCTILHRSRCTSHWSHLPVRVPSLPKRSTPYRTVERSSSIVELDQSGCTGLVTRVLPTLSVSCNAASEPTLTRMHTNHYANRHLTRTLDNQRTLHSIA